MSFYLDQILKRKMTISGRNFIIYISRIILPEIIRITPDLQSPTLKKPNRLTNRKINSRIDISCE